MAKPDRIYKQNIAQVVSNNTETPKVVRLQCRGPAVRPGTRPEQAEGPATRDAEPISAPDAGAAKRRDGHTRDGAALPERTGRGLILCADRRPIRVTYAWGTRDRGDVPTIVGTLHATAAALRTAWLAPSVSLRLSTGDRLEISVTEVSGAEARFESVPGTRIRPRRTRGQDAPGLAPS